MTITTKTGTHDWIVVASWLGAERTVFTGTVFECLAFVADQE